MLVIRGLDDRCTNLVVDRHNLDNEWPVALNKELETELQLATLTLKCCVQCFRKWVAIKVATACQCCSKSRIIS